MTPSNVLPWLALVTFGAGWGAMQPANKIAVEGGFEPFGIMVWQGVVTLILAGALAARMGRPKGRAQWAICAQVAVLGTLIPHFASFTAVTHLPAGLVAIILSTIPIFALLMGLALRREVLTTARAAGLGLGFVAMVLIAISRGDVGSGALWAVAVGLVAPLCYALNSTLLAGRGMAGLHPLQAFAGAAVIFLPVSVMAAAVTGQIKGIGADLPSLAVIATAVGHTMIYTGFLWLVTVAGAVFASQTAYLVTGFGIVWSMVLLDERYAPGVWIALALMFLGLTLVRPLRSRLAPDNGARNTVRGASPRG
ncbi:DMT family transporter [Pseudooctadecabacter sp.]|uniref:DMT family transporter n=1 Tax=Pseudooctadecabacter sp. TaxID=1966338 RepID=UPI0035C7C9CD